LASVAGKKSKCTLAPHAINLYTACSLARNGIGPNGAFVLAEALKNNTTLTTLE